MTPKEIIAVIQAFEAGKEIEGRAHCSDLWASVSEPLWNFASYDYRVAEEPPKLVPHWPAIWLNGKISYVTDRVFPTNAAAIAAYGNQTRLATEYPPIMLEVKE